jgi:ATP-binding cassette subfamily B protein
MPPAKMRGDGRKARNPKQTLQRLLGYMLKYWPILILVFVCIFVNAIASSQGSVALGRLVDDFILPMVANGSSDFAPVVSFLVELAVIYVIGIIASFLLNFLMVGVTQGIQKLIRDDMFAKMQRLPLRYFDSNAAGDIMSRYTSDVDTMRQMISQSIPQTVSSLTTLFVLLYRMITTSWMLTCVCMLTVVGIIFVTKFLAGKSGKFFIGQQRALGAVNGYIEEMVNGQKVVKVFSHEDTCKEEFDELNEILKERLAPLGMVSDGFYPATRFFHYVYSEPDNEDIRNYLEAAKLATGRDILVCGGALGDQSVIAKYGARNAFSAGPLRNFELEGGSHQPNEFVECDELVAYTKILAAYILKVLQ